MIGMPNEDGLQSLNAVSDENSLYVLGCIGVWFVCESLYGDHNTYYRALAYHDGS